MSFRRVAAPLTALVAARSWLATIYVISGFPPALIAFVLAAVLLFVGIGLTPLALVGFVLLVALLLFAGQFARFERGRLLAILGEDVAAPVSGPFTGTAFARARQLLRSRPHWRAVRYEFSLLPVQSIGLSLVVAAWCGGLTGATLPCWAWSLPGGGGTLAGHPVSAAVWLVPFTAAGVVLLLSAPWIARGWAGLLAAMVSSLLGPSGQEELRERVETLTETRTRVVDAADAERRRIERDLHDGAQQRLVALAVDLGRARARLAADPTVPEATSELVAGAHEEAKQALAEIRDLVRGIHPAVLTDRGLDAALSALAARSPIPVSVTVTGLGASAGGDGPGVVRCAPAVEAVAYFLVAEALTNVTKHSGARRAAVTVALLAEEGSRRLLVRIDDDGRGGADPRGEGLRGLADRVAALDGTFVVDSPPGGPTTLVAELPCADPVATGGNA